MKRLLNRWRQRQEYINGQWVASVFATLLLTFFRYYLSLPIRVMFVPKHLTFSFHLPFTRLIHRWLYRRKFAVFQRCLRCSDTKGRPCCRGSGQQLIAFPTRHEKAQGFKSYYKLKNGGQNDQKSKKMAKRHDGYYVGDNISIQLRFYQKVGS